MAKLGTTQREVLRCLLEHGRWHRGCGWLWNTWGGTERVMNSLVRRGLVRTQELPKLSYRTGGRELLYLPNRKKARAAL